MKYKYKVVDVHGREEFLKVVNEEGAKGWRLHSEGYHTVVLEKAVE